MKKHSFIGFIALLVCATILTAGCTSSNTSPNQSSATNTTTTSTSTALPTSAQQNVVVTTTPLSTEQTPQLTPKARIPTEIGGNKWVSLAMDNGIVRGQEYALGWVISVPGHINDHRVCGQWANFYIDNQPAGGKWLKWDYIDGGGLYCVVSVGLSLSSADTETVAGDGYAKS